MSRREAAQRMELISGGLELRGVAGADLIVEAVVERMDVKRAVLKETEEHVRAECVLATNTSSLSVDAMAEALQHPERFCGMHFFNPVDRMPLVEVVRGSRSSDEAVATVHALSLRLGKVPVVVRDGPGFVVNRILGPYLNEAGYLVQKLCRVVMGTNNVDHCTRLCHASSVAALMEGISSGAVSNQVNDVLRAEVVFLIGANPTSNHPVAATWMKNAAERGVKLIVADPRRTELARHAAHFLQFKPDTDVALLNAMMHTIVPMASTAALTKPSNRRSMSSYKRLFSSATAAWPASAVTSSTVRREYGTTCASTSSCVASSASGARFRLISCKTPMTSSW